MTSGHAHAHHHLVQADVPSLRLPDQIASETSHTEAEPLSPMPAAIHSRTTEEPHPPKLVSNHVCEDPVASEKQWVRRHQKRLASVAAIRKTCEYCFCLGMGTGDHHSKRTPSPNPYDRSISKRAWENLIMQWRKDLKNLSKIEQRYDDTSLLQSFWQFGIMVEVTRSGPYWALLDGNVMLAPFGYTLQFVDACDLKAGRYIIWQSDCFTAAEIVGDIITVSHGITKWKYHLPDFNVNPSTTFYRLTSRSSEDLEKSWGALHDRLGR